MPLNKSLCLIVLVFAALFAAGCSGGELGGSTELNNASPSPVAGETPAMALGEHFPAIPLDDELSPDNKAASFVTSVDPTTPFFSHRSANCAVEDTCRIIQGLYDMPATHVPPPPYYAFAAYKVPLGATEDELLSLAMQGHTATAGEQMWFALANYSAMHWQWYGPGATGEFSLDFETLGYDFTSPAGNMYFVVFVMPENTYHIEDIQLKFKGGGTIGGGVGGGGDEWWNVWGRAYVNSSTGVPLPGAMVEFEDLNTGVTYTTVADGTGNWGMNLPTGEFRFRVYANTVLIDLPINTVIDNFDLELNLAGGQFTYEGDNAAYDGTVVPMPLITTDVY